MAPLSTALDDPNAIPYFTWDHPMTVAEIHHKLANASEPERIRVLGLILREAKDTDVWKFTTPREVVAMWPKVEKHLGRRRGFWIFLLDLWRRLGLLDD
jgi:hypothetical protein